MGEPIRIADVADRLIRHSGRQIEIVYIGLTDGEKLHEDLLNIGEDGTRPFHPKITHVPAVPLDPLPHLDLVSGDGSAVRMWLAQLAADGDSGVNEGADSGLIPGIRQGSPAIGQLDAD